MLRNTLTFIFCIWLVGQVQNAETVAKLFGCMVLAAAFWIFIGLLNKSKKNENKTNVNNGRNHK